MAYYRGYGKNNKRYVVKRYKKKGNKSFSKFNTYNNRSAKSQANQIYRLNKKVNKIYKETKKDTHYFESSNVLVQHGTTSNDTYFPEYEDSHVEAMYQQTGSVDGSAIIDGTNHTFIDYLAAVNAKGGRETIHLKNGVIYGSLSKLAYITGASEKFVNYPYSYVHVDMYVVQQKQSTDVGNADLMFGNNWKNYKPYDVMRPLNSGCWQYVKVLKHKHIVVKSTDVNTKSFKIKYTPYYKTISSTKVGNFEQLIRGIYVVYRMYASSSQSSFYTYDTSSTQVSILDNKEFAYPIEFNVRQYFTV